MPREHLRRPMTGYQGLVVLIAAFSLAAAALALSLQANRRSEAREQQARRASEQAWCSIIVTMDDRYRQTPPTTAAGRNMAAGIANLRTTLRCPPPPPTE